MNKYNFKGVGDEEQIICVIRRNWFYIAQQFFIIFVMLGVLAASFFFLPVYFPIFNEIEFRKLFFFINNLFLIAIWILGFLIWIDYYFDIWIVTSDRVINIEQKGLFSRKISECKYGKIQDVTAQVYGFIPTMINYGDVFIQTAGENEQFVFRTVSDPYKIKDLIMQQIEIGKEKH